MSKQNMFMISLIVLVAIYWLVMGLRFLLQ